MPAVKAKTRTMTVPYVNLAAQYAAERDVILPVIDRVLAQAANGSAGRWSRSSRAAARAISAPSMSSASPPAPTL